MENIEAGVPQSDEGVSTVTTVQADAPECWPISTPFVAGAPVEQASDRQPDAVVDLGPSANPTPAVEEPKGPITEAQYRKMRGQYFTVRHIPLTDCGHKMDVINEPRHRNCENCFFQWMNFHPKLVETVDEAWREHGRAFVIKLRGKHFADQFGRYMATIAAFKEQEKNENRTSTEGSTAGSTEAGDVGSAVESGQTQIPAGGDEESQ